MKLPPLLVTSRLYLALFGAIVCASAAETPATNKLAPNFALNLEAKLLRPSFSSDNKYLYWLNQSEGKLQRLTLADHLLDARAVELTEGAADFCLSPEGTIAWVAATPNSYSAYRSEEQQSGSIQVIDTQQMTVTRSFAIAIDPFEMVCDSAGFLYISPGSGQWVKLHKIDPRRSSVLFSFASTYGKSNLRITPNGRRLYFATNGVSPGDVNAVTIPSDAKTPAQAYDSPYHGEHPLGGAFDITPDGKFIVNRAGTVVRLGTSKGSDMLFVAALGENLAMACDPASGRLWLALQDGRLVTYRYPDFAIENTQFLPNRVQSLVYDAARSTLWTAWTWEKGGVGGIDGYDLKNPAAYPNQITRAREEIRTARIPQPLDSLKSPTRFPGTAPVVEPSAATVAPAKTSAKAPPDAAAASTPEQRAENLLAVRNDGIVNGLLVVSVVLVVWAAFFGRRVAMTSVLRPPTPEDHDPVNWPLPLSIKIIGWIAALNAAGIASLIWMTALQGPMDKVLVYARTTAGVVLALAGVAAGILRGYKLPYLGYGALIVFTNGFLIYRGFTPGFLGGVLLLAMIHYGRQHWDSLS